MNPENFYLKKRKLSLTELFSRMGYNALFFTVYYYHYFFVITIDTLSLFYDNVTII